MKLQFSVTLNHPIFVGCFSLFQFDDLSFNTTNRMYRSQQPIRTNIHSPKQHTHTHMHCACMHKHIIWNHKSKRTICFRSNWKPTNKNNVTCTHQTNGIMNDGHWTSKCNNFLVCECVCPNLEYFIYSHAVPCVRILVCFSLKFFCVFFVVVCLFNFNSCLNLNFCFGFCSHNDKFLNSYFQFVILLIFGKIV